MKLFDIVFKQLLTEEYDILVLTSFSMILTDTLSQIGLRRKSKTAISGVEKYKRYYDTIVGKDDHFIGWFIKYGS